MLLLSKVEGLNLQVVAVLMPLEIEHHTIPHLKALTCIIEDASEQGRCSTFKQCYTVLKRSILLNKWTKRRFLVTVAIQAFSSTFKQNF